MVASKSNPPELNKVTSPNVNNEIENRIGKTCIIIDIDIF